jgi:hypothetical protein
MIGAIIALLILSVVVLSALGRDISQVVDFFTVAVLPTAVALWAGNSANKAKEAATQAVHNTNGRMRELIQLLQAGGSVEDLDPEKYAEFLAELPVNPENR